MLWTLALLAQLSDRPCLPPDAMEPGFFAISVPHDREMAEWYMQAFSALLVKRNEARNGSGYAQILAAGPLVTELIYHKRPLDRQTLVPNSRAIQWSGIVKAGPAVRADLKEVAACFEGRGIKTIWLVSDAQAGMDNLRIEDPNGTPIDILGARLASVRVTIRS